MRLVDADALCTYIENEFDGVCVYDVSGNEAAREFCDMVDIAPTIDAIPVEWIRKYTAVGIAPNGRRLTEGKERIVINRMLNEWQKEQEARA